MTIKSKRQRAINDLLSANKQSSYSVPEALELLKQCPAVKFTETVDIAINMGVDPRKSDQIVRGSVVLPHGTGKVKKVAVYCEGEDVAKAQEAGADIVGSDELAEDIKAGRLNFDILIATPEQMAKVGRLGQILGPRGLMPNPKLGTVTKDVADAVAKAKAGQVNFRTDKGGVVHCPLGLLSFSGEQISANLEALLAELRRLKPASSKGTYLQKLSLSTTMGPGLPLAALA